MRHGRPRLGARISWADAESNLRVATAPGPQHPSQRAQGHGSDLRGWESTVSQAMASSAAAEARDCRLSPASECSSKNSEPYRPPGRQGQVTKYTKGSVRVHRTGDQTLWIFLQLRALTTGPESPMCAGCLNAEIHHFPLRRRRPRTILGHANWKTVIPSIQNEVPDSKRQPPSGCPMGIIPREEAWPPPNHPNRQRIQPRAALAQLGS